MVTKERWEESNAKQRMQIITRVDITIPFINLQNHAIRTWDELPLWLKKKLDPVADGPENIKDNWDLGSQGERIGLMSLADNELSYVWIRFWAQKHWNELPTRIQNKLSKMHELSMRKKEKI
jgi:hypothetical protein